MSDVTRWMFSGAAPSGYLVSPLNALGQEPLIETLELSVAGLKMSFSAVTAEHRLLSQFAVRSLKFEVQAALRGRYRRS